MRWSKIKNIIILLLILVNGFLLAQVSLRSLRSRQARLETRERTVAILERNDVAFLPQEVPGELELTGRRVTLSPPGEAEAAALVGPALGQETLGARTTYRGPLGAVTLSSSGEVEVLFSDAARPAGSDRAAQGLELLSPLGIQARLSDWEESDDGAVFRYIQLWNGVPIPEWSAVLSWGAQGLERLTVRRLAGVEELLPAQETLDAATALIRLLDELNRGEGYVCSQISDIYPGYLVSGTGTLTLTPAWFIETDTWRFAVDGHTGAVSATE
ncbi:MAG: hypothetical protein HFF06_10195 [Oscillospiraceae bacterium]|jgi:hypothetical protein|nr:hypothetical protein [Oscillospiraceae bacterium]